MCHGRPHLWRLASPDCLEESVVRRALWLSAGLLLLVGGTVVSSSNQWWALPFFAAFGMCVAEAFARHGQSS